MEASLPGREGRCLFCVRASVVHFRTVLWLWERGFCASRTRTGGEPGSLTPRVAGAPVTCSRSENLSVVSSGGFLVFVKTFSLTPT